VGIEQAGMGLDLNRRLMLQLCGSAIDAGLPTYREMFVDILSLIARLREPSRQYGEAKGSNAPATSAKVCLNLAKSVGLCAPVRSTTGFDRPLLALSRFAGVQGGQRIDSRPETAGYLANVS
jgi:hypothetical protein